MNRGDVEQEVVQILRQRILLGSDRAIPPNEPLGLVGTGLDSLAVVEFLTSLEVRFGIEFPDAVWTDRKQFTVCQITDYLVALGAPHTRRSPDQLGWSPRTHAGAQHSRWPKVAAAIRELGLWRGLFWMLSRGSATLWRLVLEKQRFHVLAFDLAGQSIPDHPPPPGIVLRELTQADTAAVSDFWKHVPFDGEVQGFEERPTGDYVRLSAWDGDKIVGLDWVSGDGADEISKRLKVRLREGSCLGSALVERETHRGRGIGLALLTASLVESRKRGYRKQLTYVGATNLRMLTAAVQLFGFQKIGEIRITRVLRLPLTRWHIGERKGWWGVLEL